VSQRPWDGYGLSSLDFPSGSDPFSRVPSSRAGRRVLLIDDSATVRAALSARLTVRGFRVRTVGNLVDTNKSLVEFDPEFVVTDVRMPDAQGDDICRTIKACMKKPIPVILYSSLPRRLLADCARAAGADAYVCKTEGIDALIRRMDEVLNGPNTV
jgi:DNA-binding response OmpR family regulator